MEKLAIFFPAFVVFLFSLSFHEAAHAWMANRKGDSTARMLGRMTLNPIPHIDPIGTLLFPALGFFLSLPILFGWAKPVPVNERNLRNPRMDGLLVAVAGPLSNLLLALLFTGVLYLLYHVSPPASGIVEAGSARTPLIVMAHMGIRLNLLLALFNLLPVPPLDGSRVWAYFRALREPLRWLNHYGYVVLLVLMFTGVFGVLIFYPTNWLYDLLVGLVS